MAKKNFKKAIDSISLKEKSGLSAVFSSTEKPIPEINKNLELEETEDEKMELRQSFIILEEDFETLKNFVYAKKKIDPSYSQKDALHEALLMLFSTMNDIPDRPVHVKKAERKRSRNLSRSRRS